MAVTKTAVPQASLAAVQDGTTKAISVTERETPKPTSTQVLVKVNCTGVCASDLHLARRDLPYLQPTVSIGGHEGAGIIAALGPEVDGNQWQVGDRVAVRWLHRVCGKCEPCTTGSENLCPNRKISGKDVEGCFAQYALADSAYLVRLPEEVSDAEAAPILCAGVTVYKALKVAGLREGSWVAIAGAGGGLGHLAIQYAKAMGLRPLALDAGKKEICEALGAETYVDVMQTKDCVADVIEATGGGAHGALVCASAGRAYADAVKYLRRAGTMVCIGLPPKPSPIPVLPEDFIARGITIKGTSTGTLEDTNEALGFLARGEVKPRITVRSLGEVDSALREIEEAKVEGRIVLQLDH
ncbi:alcohol dehydrogenase [Pleurostoma richardsiae]|uniref:Alcohol dehydrogenase n=1 Tax=Pleurostoma richardsiae TaxID=41990 RepID=A0AA38RDZ7_9PEZI|nr:alcohol dehydrogenase [Pleurostoma richardsiae]